MNYYEGIFYIIKKVSGFWHHYNNESKKVNISDFEVVLEAVENTFTIQCKNGSNVPAQSVRCTDIIVIDETGDGLEKMYPTVELLKQALTTLGYTAYVENSGSSAPTTFDTWTSKITLSSGDNTFTLPDNVVIHTVEKNGSVPLVVRDSDSTPPENKWYQTGNVIEFYDGVDDDEFYLIGEIFTSTTPPSFDYVQGLTGVDGVIVDNTNPNTPVSRLDTAFTDNRYSPKALVEQIDLYDGNTDILDQIIVLRLFCFYGIAFNEIRVRSDSGTAMLTFMIDGSNIIGLESITVDDSGNNGTATADNIAAEGSMITMQITGATGLAGLKVSAKITRTP